VRGGPLDEFATLGSAVQRRALAVHDGSNGFCCCCEHARTLT
jgi:hypothetical protein